MESLQNPTTGYREVAEAGKETPWEETTPWEKAKIESRYLLRAYLWLFALAFASALLTPRDILTSYPILRIYFIAFSYTASFFFGPNAVDKFVDISHFDEVALFTVALLNIASIPLLIFCSGPPSKGWFKRPFVQSVFMTSIMVGRILSSQMMLDFYLGLLQKGYISNEVVNFMLNSRMGVALSAILFMMIAPILIIALRFLINFLAAPSAK